MSSLVEVDTAYAERTASKVIEMCKLFCTPLGASEVEQDVFDKLRLATRSIIVDGALINVARVLKEKFMHNIVLICRDPAHMIRAACAEPLCRTSSFERQHELLFSRRHALMKEVQYSDVLQARLEACQAVVIAEHGAQGGGVVSIYRHFKFAPHRWESFAAPRRQ